MDALIGIMCETQNVSVKVLLMIIDQYATSHLSYETLFDAESSMCKHDVLVMVVQRRHKLGIDVRYVTRRTLSNSTCKLLTHV
ncbi:hypothetical protein KPH14_009730 [Odynerus spinipes]|uniref:Uncharacterized protein n=1 Tax=Odynerus spinipes TaxID=1348599 RepID=A0AAD9RR74_9HYME|nr:hypothetical protein KPH14_009730 [Odynerus spinipes]